MSLGKNWLEVFDQGSTWPKVSLIGLELGLTWSELSVTWSKFVLTLTSNTTWLCHVVLTLVTISLVLHILHFSHNLLPVNALIGDLNCKIKFFPSHCVIQKLSTGKMIGNGRVHNGLYQLVKGPLLKGHALLDEYNSAHHQILQWHRRLRYPSFLILKTLSHLFKQCNVETFACELAKHTRNSYPSVNNKRSLHNDLLECVEP